MFYDNIIIGLQIVKRLKGQLTACSNQLEIGLVREPHSTDVEALEKAGWVCTDSPNHRMWYVEIP